MRPSFSSTTTTTTHSVGAEDILANEFTSLKISALTNAAKISHLISEATIGPNSKITNDENINPDKSSIITSRTEDNNVQSTNKSKWKPNAFYPITDTNIDLTTNNNRNTESIFKIIDPKVISFKMAIESAEKRRRAKVKQELAERNARYDAIYAANQQKILEFTKQSRENAKLRAEQQNHEVIETAKKYDAIVATQQKLAVQAFEEQKQRSVERTQKLRREAEIKEVIKKLKALKTIFVEKYPEFVQITLLNETKLVNFHEYRRNQENIFRQYEQIMNRVVSGQTTDTEVNDLQKLCDEIVEFIDRINGDLADFERGVLLEMDRLRKQQEFYNENQQVHNNVLQDQQQQQQQPQQQQQLPQVSQHQPQTKQTDVTDGGNITNRWLNYSNLDELEHFISKSRFQFYVTIMDFYEQYSASIQPLLNDENLKKFRFNCQKAVNIPINAISSVSPEHLQDKYDRLMLLVSGKHVKINETNFSAAEYQLGVEFCVLLIAQKFVSQADTIISSSVQAAYPFAAVLVALWNRFPNIGILFLGCLYKQCPYLVPFFIPQLSDQSNESYYRSIGYRYNDGVLEKQDQYLKRISGFIRLYAAVMITKQRQEFRSQSHPHGIENGWIWLSNFINLEPLPSLSATLIDEFLQITGSQLWSSYGLQFLKILAFIQLEYIPELNRIDEGGPKARLEALMLNTIRDNKIEPPDGQLPDNFW